MLYSYEMHVNRGGLCDDLAQICGESAVILKNCKLLCSAAEFDFVLISVIAKSKHPGGTEYKC